MSRVLVYGGTFDPPHLGHTVLSQQAMKQQECDKVVFVIAAKNPLKDTEKLTVAKHRLAMLKLALAGLPWAEISTIELERGGTSYTIDTLEAFAKMNPVETKLTLLIGADQTESFRQWHRPDDIEALANIVVLSREGSCCSGFETLPLQTMPISSTSIRACVAEGSEITGFVNPLVAAYIAEHGLYK